MQSIDAALAGNFQFDHQIKINRMGFGAMRIVGKGVWGDLKIVRKLLQLYIVR